MATTTRTRREQQPRQRIPKRPSKYPPVATGTLSWVARPDAGGDGGLLRINDKVYRVIPVRADARRDASRRVIGYRLAKVSSNDSYDVERCEDGTLSCECMDYCHNRQFAVTAQLRCCKHIVALTKALAVARLPLPAPDGWGRECDDMADHRGHDGDPWAHGE